MKSKSSIQLYVCAIILVMIVGCNSKKEKSLDSKYNLHSGILHDNMDTLVNPGDDFFHYVNGKWLRENNIPDAMTKYGVGNLADKIVIDRVRNIVEACANGDFDEGSDKQKVGDLYASAIDMKTRNELGLRPLESSMQKIDSIRNYNDLASYFGFASRHYGRLPLQLNFWPDLENSDKFNVYISQHGLGLPDREYYLAEDERSKIIRNKYEQLIVEVLAKANVQESSNAAKKVLKLESRLAAIQMSKEDRKDYTQLYNIFATSRIDELMPDFNWENYLTAAGLEDRDTIVVEMVEYTKSLDKLITTTPIADWKIYLKWCLIEQAKYILSEDIFTTFFNFYRKELLGVKSEKPIWESAIWQVDYYLGQLVVKLYGKEYIASEEIKKVEAIIKNIKLAFEDGIKELDWMSAETKKHALKKLSTLSSLIVYPKRWRDFSKVSIRRNDYFGNIWRLEQFNYDYYHSLLNKPIDKYDLEMSLFSGRYEATSNIYQIGAIFFQPPYFDITAEDAVNYGGIGSVIGHEMGHAFDDLHSNFDHDGNKVDWWNESDKKEFKKLKEKLIAQFNQYTVLDSLHVNGEYTVGENMADLTSVVIPLKAYELSLKGAEGPTLDHFTALQRFFISYGQVWMYKSREEGMRKMIATNHHAPEHLRVNGIVRNVLEFYTAFDVKKGNTLYLAPEDRVKIW